MDKLKALCASYQASGLYTHVYVACGFLDAAENSFEFSLLPDGRDVFDLSSLTKALVTTPLVLWRVDEKGGDVKKTLVSQVFGSRVVAEAGAREHDHTVAAFLRHETGLPAWRNYYVFCGSDRQKPEDVLARVVTSGSAADLYSDVGFITLGQFLEKNSGKSILMQWREQLAIKGIHVSDGLGGSQELAKKRMISSGYCPVRKRELLGEVHDENCWALGGYTGHAGLFGSGVGVSSFLRSLWQAKEGQPVFDLNFSESQSSGESLMGWRKGRDESAKTFASGRGCGHLGFTGTAFWVDPITRSYAVVLTNRIISSRISPAIKKFRAEAFSTLWELLQAGE